MKEIRVLINGEEKFSEVKTAEELLDGLCFNTEDNIAVERGDAEFPEWVESWNVHRVREHINGDRDCEIPEGYVHLEEENGPSYGWLMAEAEYEKICRYNRWQSE